MLLPLAFFACASCFACAGYIFGGSIRRDSDYDEGYCAGYQAGHEDGERSGRKQAAAAVRIHGEQIIRKAMEGSKASW